MEDANAKFALVLGGKCYFEVLNVLFNTVQGSWLIPGSLFLVVLAMLDDYSKSDTSKPFTQ